MNCDFSFLYVYLFIWNAWERVSLFLFIFVQIVDIFQTRVISSNFIAFICYFIFVKESLFYLFFESDFMSKIIQYGDIHLRRYFENYKN